MGGVGIHFALATCGLSFVQAVVSHLFTLDWVELAGQTYLVEVDRRCFMVLGFAIAHGNIYHWI